MKRKIKRWISALLGAVMAAALMPVTAYAGFSRTAALPTAAGSTLTDGNIYLVTNNVTISGSTGANALNVASGATVVINIPSGYTLTVNGGTGSATSRGGAGIYLPQDATLILTGGGRLVAYGGNAGSGRGGYSGSSGQLSIGGNWFKGGTGGSGGYGGGGAGAGIGGYGGTGGSGGSCPETSRSDCYHTSGRRDGSNGYAGGNGTSGTPMGTLYVLNTVTVNAYGGAYGSFGYGGGQGSSANDRGSGWKNNYTAAGGGGGGGGGGGYYAYDIGGGGGGAGGGGAGGGGGNYTDSDHYYYNYGGGGSGGGGYNSGYSGSGSRTSHSNWWGGYGGSGGASGGRGAGGYIYQAPGATVSGGRYGIGSTVKTYTEVPGAAGYLLSFDQQGGTGGGSDFNIVYGTKLPTVDVPAKEHHAFMGYYTSAGGSGTRYYDQRGAGLKTWDSVSDVTLYAYWVQNQFNVTLDRQTGTGGTASFITTGTDGTLPDTITPPAKTYFAFNGYYDKASGMGTKYFNADGTAVAGEKITANTVLYAAWTQKQYKVTFNRQGGSGGTDTAMTTGEDGTLPEIIVPTRLGRTFAGYSDRIANGELFYDADGRTTGKTLSSDTTLYAQWGAAQYHINYELDGGTITGNPADRKFTESISIPNPEKAEYYFLGWQVDDGMSRYRDFVIPAGSALYAKDITLTARWAKSVDSEVTIAGNVAVAPGNDAELREALRASFGTMVADPAAGVTTDDLAGDKNVKLVLTINLSEDQTDHGKIGEIAQGSALNFYDIKAEKEVTDGINVTTTLLNELPEPIEVKIPLEGELAGKTSYRVYRVHNAAAEALPAGPASGE